ncbi:MAG: glycosyltransferase family 2 protein [Candidatus Limnocylindrales bacterium]
MRAAETATKELSIVVVHYETPDELSACLESVQAATTSVSAEVFVVDNASADFDPIAVNTILPNAVVLAGTTNEGFARGANRALRQASGLYVLLLNPDTMVAPDSLRVMVDYMDAHPDVGCSTARLIMQDGRLDLACRRSFPTPKRALFRLTMLSKLFPRSRTFAQYNLTYLDEHQEAEIDSPCGAFMMVRSDVVKTVGLLDEAYFMYGEDLDWAYRIKHAGWRVMYTPLTTVTHIKRASSRQSRPRTIRAFYDAMRIFFRRHYEEQYSRPVAWLTYAAINMREVLELTSARISNRGARA